MEEGVVVANYENYLQDLEGFWISNEDYLKLSLPTTDNNG